MNRTARPAATPPTGRVLASPTRRAVLEQLRAAREPMTVTQMSEAVRLHVNTVRGYLDLLVDVGLAHRETESRTTPGRPRTLYSAAPTNPEPDGYQLLVEVLARHLEDSHPADTAEAARAAGERWARAVDAAGWVDGEHEPAEAVDALVALFRHLGFQPDTDPVGDRIYLRRCPFGQAAAAHSTVVCGVHLGLVQGTLARLGTSVSAERLDPFVRDDLCVLHLNRSDVPPSTRSPR